MSADDLPTSLSRTREAALFAVATGWVAQSTRSSHLYAEGTYVPRDQSGYEWLAEQGYIETTHHPVGVRRVVVLTESGRALYASVRGA